jgi:hypothetical protein
MQREIKFRGQRVDNKEWVYGYLVGGNFNDNERHDVYMCQGVGGACIEVIPSTVGQYTGLKEYYQSDFVEDENGAIYLIDFRYGSWALVHSPKTGSEREGEPKWDYLYDADKFLSLQIIGSNHTHPELIKQ